jgi:hypothetical protein
MDRKLNVHISFQTVLMILRNVLYESKYCIKKNTKAPLNASKEVGVQVNIKKLM